jgi:ATP-dependent helicase/nuclease subunit B
VLITRSEREGGAPTVPSRWLARLDALLGYEYASPAPPPVYIQRGLHFAQWAEAIDRPADYRPWGRPKPTPPLAARPTELYVTAVEQWRRDPYGLYARYILGLRLLDPLEAELGAADRGSALHDALDAFMKDHPSGLLPPDAVARFEAVGEQHFGTLLAAPAERAFWWPRFQRLVRWFVATENRRRSAGIRVLGGETSGELKVGSLTIKARADRIDELEEGVWEIIDYKTGRTPSPKELKALFAPQLLLEAAMAERGGFGKIAGKAEETHLSYWRANGLDEGGKVVEIKDSAELVPAMLAMVEKMVAHFANPAAPYPRFPIRSSSRTSTTMSTWRVSPNGRRRTGARNERRSRQPPDRRRHAATRDLARHLGLGRGQCRDRQDQGADRSRGAPAALGCTARAHPVPHLHQGGRRRDAQSPRRSARPLGARRHGQARR